MTNLSPNDYIMLSTHSSLLVGGGGGSVSVALWGFAASFFHRSSSRVATPEGSLHKSRADDYIIIPILPPHLLVTNDGVVGRVLQKVVDVVVINLTVAHKHRVIVVIFNVFNLGLITNTRKFAVVVKIVPKTQIARNFKRSCSNFHH